MQLLGMWSVFHESVRQNFSPSKYAGEMNIKAAIIAKSDRKIKYLINFVGIFMETDIGPVI